MAGPPVAFDPPLWPACVLRRMLEVTGGSMSTIYESSHADFPALYAVSYLTVRSSSSVCLGAVSTASARPALPACLR